jgi:hypothetical protein
MAGTYTSSILLKNILTTPRGESITCFLYGRREPFGCSERAPMPIQSQANSRLCSRSPIPACNHSPNLTARAMFGLGALAIQGISVYPASSGPSVSSTHHKQEEALRLRRRGESDGDRARSPAKAPNGMLAVTFVTKALPKISDVFWCPERRCELRIR